MEEFIRRLEEILEESVQGVTAKEAETFIRSNVNSKKVGEAVAVRGEVLGQRTTSTNVSYIRERLETYGIGIKKAQQKFLCPELDKRVNKSCFLVARKVLRQTTLEKIDE
ncbi:unnamed protein product, partial [Porites evermanni]